MTAPAPEPSDTQLDRLVAARTAELTELLGHLATCWDDQRRQLARQLHDSLGSSMTALTMHLALLTQQLPADKALQDRSAQMKQLLTNIINTNRQMQLALWNDKLEFLGVKAALSELATEFGDAQKIAVRLSLPEQEATVPRLHGVALLRCLEEGLSNIAAHAGASEVDVILDDNDEQLMLTVRDNGVGIGQAAATNERHGLRLLRERAAYLGGTLSVAAPPVPAHGTVLTLVLPRGEGEAGAVSAA